MTQKLLNQHRYLILLFLFLNIQYSLELDPNNYENVRILTSYLNDGVILRCPQTGSPLAPNTLIDENFISWLNEEGQSNKQDNEIVLTNGVLLTSNGINKFELVFNRPFKDISCGFFYNNKYTRIKKWKLSYVDRAEVELTYKLDPSSFKINKFNQTFNEIEYLLSNASLISLTQSGNIFQLGCTPNFDLPLPTSTLIWLYNYKFNIDGKIVSNETWSRYHNYQYNAIQTFERNNQAEEFINILRNIFINPAGSVIINLQCVAYAKRDAIIAVSKDFHLVRARSPIGPGGSTGGGGGGLTTTELILVIVFSILGFLLLLALLLLLILCCCFPHLIGRKSNSTKEKKTTKSKTKTTSKTMTTDEIEESFGGRNSRIIPITPITAVNNNENLTRIDMNNDNAGKVTFRTSFHLDNLNQQQQQPVRYNNESSSIHVTTIPSIQRNDLVLRKDPNYDSYTYSHAVNFNDNNLSNIKEYDDSEYYHDQQNSYLYKKEMQNYYEIKRTTQTIPSISGTSPIELHYTDMMHQV